MNSVTNALRNTFLNRVPTTEEIASSCRALAEKLCADATARTDVKLALVDVLDEALQGLYSLTDVCNIFGWKSFKICQHRLKSRRSETGN